MLSPVRVSARTRSLFQCSAWLVFAITLVAAACTDTGPLILGSGGSGGAGTSSGTSTGGAADGGGSGDASVGAGARAGSPDAGSPAGGQAGEPGQSSGGEGGMNGGEPSVGGAAAGTGGEGGDGTPPTDAGLPCALKNLIGTRCLGCHARPPILGTNVSLLTHDDLTAPSPSNPQLTVAARSLQRMKDSLAPMPPAPATHATSEEIATLQTWLDAGAPRGTCNYDPNDPNSNPYDAPAQCSSNSYWGGNDTGSTWMMPGRACVTCHRQMGNFAPQFSVAGTVFRTAHEPDKCFGVPLATGAQIIITDANGQELSPISVVSGGNFGLVIPGLALPYRAKVVVGSEERVMLTPQMNGDCNACHSQNGAQGALGRIIVP